jgi:hypothetical protein
MRRIITALIALTVLPALMVVAAPAPEAHAFSEGGIVQSLTVPSGSCPHPWSVGSWAQQAPLCRSQLASSNTNFVEMVIVVGLKTELSRDQCRVWHDKPRVILEAPELAGGAQQGQLRFAGLHRNHH